jgi:hypothetical protein
VPEDVSIEILDAVQRALGSALAFPPVRRPEPIIVEGLIVPPRGKKSVILDANYEDANGTEEPKSFPKNELVLHVYARLGLNISRSYLGSRVRQGHERYYLADYFLEEEILVLTCNAHGFRSYVLFDVKEDEVYDMLNLDKRDLMQLCVEGSCNSVIWDSNTGSWEQKMISAIWQRPQVVTNPRPLPFRLAKRAEKMSEPEYYADPDMVRFDIDSFFAALNIPDWSQLIFRRFLSAQIACADGEVRRGEAWLDRASKALEFSEGRARDPIRRKVLFLMLRCAGYEPMDLAYVLNKINVREDLEAFMDLYGVPQLAQLPTSFSKKKIQTVSGWTCNLRAYTARIGILLGLIKNGRELYEGGKAAMVLESVLKNLGEEVVRIEPMDKPYFEDTANVRADLAAFAHEASLPVEEMTLARMKEVQARCANGEIVKGRTYLGRAGKSLYDYEHSEAFNKVNSTLSWLKSL